VPSQREKKKRRGRGRGRGGGGHEARTSSASSSSPQRGGVILADEPTTGLDAHQADKIVQKLRETAVEEAAAVVCVVRSVRTVFHPPLGFNV
jgi:ABC-type phosphate/phosphonate transport system ATPase subunit